MVIPMAIMCVFATLFYQFGFIHQVEMSYQPTNVSLYNPMMGYAPTGDYVELVGDNTLVFVSITFRELEPKEGVYDFASIRKKYFLDRWRAEGKQVVFRFICDYPRKVKHMDIPDWLYKKTKDGDFYNGEYGKGYSPNYSNKTFIKYHEKAIMALGKEFGKDEFFFFIELGSIGHWGEWHVNYSEGIRRLPDEKTCEAYIKPYVKAFPKAFLLMRRPFLLAKTYSTGVYNDMTGAPIATATWLNWINKGGVYTEPIKPHSLVPRKAIWESRPLGGEFTSALSMPYMLDKKRKRTLDLLGKSHMTFIGPKIPTKEDGLASYNKVNHMIQKKLGYRIGVEKSKITFNSLFNTSKIVLTIGNHGVAPMYVNWPMYLYVMNDKSQVAQKYKIPLDLRKLSGGEKVTLTVTLKSQLLVRDKKPLAIGIENPNSKQPAIFLDMDNESVDKRYILWKKK